MAERTHQENPTIHKWKFLVRHNSHPPVEQGDRNPCSFLPDSSVSRNPCSCAGGLVRGPVDPENEPAATHRPHPPLCPFQTSRAFWGECRPAPKSSHGSSPMEWTPPISRGHDRLLPQIRPAHPQRIRGLRPGPLPRGSRENLPVRRDAWHFLRSPLARRKGLPRNGSTGCPLFTPFSLFAANTRHSGPRRKIRAFPSIKFRDALESDTRYRPGRRRPRLRTTTDLSGADLIQSLIADLDSLLG